MAKITSPDKVTGQQHTAEEYNAMKAAINAAYDETGNKVSTTDPRLSDARVPLPHPHTKSQITDFPTLGTASALNVPAAGDATTGQVVKGNDSRLTDARTPLSHPHAPNEIQQDANNRFVTDAEKATWNAAASTNGVEFDATPVQNSTKAVTSGGLFTALQGKQATGSYATTTQLTSGLAGKADVLHSTPAGTVTQDATHRFVTDTEKSTWSGKQNNLTSGSPIPITSLKALTQAAYDALTKDSGTIYFIQ